MDRSVGFSRNTVLDFIPRIWASDFLNTEFRDQNARRRACQRYRSTFLRKTAEKFAGRVCLADLDIGFAELTSAGARLSISGWKSGQFPLGIG